VCVPAVVLVGVASFCVWAQPPDEPTHPANGPWAAGHHATWRNFYDIDVVDAIASRIYAEADLTRAVGEAAVDFEVARRLRAETVRRQIQNSVLRVKAYWDRRSIMEAELLKRRYDELKVQRRRASKTWGMLKDFPYFAPARITNGDALNFLLHRLAVTLLAYEFTGNSSADALRKDKDLRLTPEVLHALRLRQAQAGGKVLVFRADEHEGMNLDWWPAALRLPVFRPLRERVQAARERVLQLPADDEESLFAALQELDTALLQLVDQFEKYYTRDRIFERGYSSWAEYKTADAFLKNLVGEVGRIRQTGRPPKVPGPQRFCGGNVVDLIKHMCENGLEFAPALPGDEFAYFKVFKQLRDLYVVAVSSDSIQSE